MIPVNIIIYRVSVIECPSVALFYATAVMAKSQIIVAMGGIYLPSEQFCFAPKD